MGITAVLETGSGERLQTVEDPTNILHRILPSDDDSSYQCLRYIDWYGDTVFNYLQAEQFLKEWASLRDKIRTPEEKALFTGIQELALRLQNERHVYLKFYGD